MRRGRLVNVSGGCLLRTNHWGARRLAGDCVRVAQIRALRYMARGVTSAAPGRGSVATTRNGGVR